MGQCMAKQTANGGPYENWVSPCQLAHSYNAILANHALGKGIVAFRLVPKKASRQAALGSGVADPLIIDILTRHFLTFAL